MLVRGERYVYTYDVSFQAMCFRVQFGMMIKSPNGIELGGHSTGREDQLRTIIEAGKSLTVRFEFSCDLLPGFYFMNAGVGAILGDEWGYLHRLVDAYLFRVQDEADLHRSGFVDFGIQVQIDDGAPAPLQTDTNPPDAVTTHQQTQALAG